MVATTSTPEKIEISYVFSLTDDGIADLRFQAFTDLEEWLPARENLYITMNGIEQSSAQLQIFGFGYAKLREMFQFHGKVFSARV